MKRPKCLVEGCDNPVTRAQLKSGPGPYLSLCKSCLFRKQPVSKDGISKTDGIVPRIKERSYHFDEALETDEDRIMGCQLSWYIGDTWIICERDSPQKQWTEIAKALRFHGLKIVERKGGL